MVRTLPPRGHFGDICPAMLHMAYLQQRKYVESGNEADVSVGWAEIGGERCNAKRGMVVMVHVADVQLLASHAWVKTAHWAYRVLLGDRAGGQTFTRLYQAQLDRLKKRKQMADALEVAAENSESDDVNAEGDEGGGDVVNTEMNTSQPTSKEGKQGRRHPDERAGGQSALASFPEPMFPEGKRASFKELMTNFR